MIALFVDLFEAWGFTGLTVAVNSVGTPEIRAAYGEALRAWLEPERSKLSGDSLRRLVENPLRVLDTKDEGDHALFAALRSSMPRLLDTLDAETRAHWDAVLAGLQALGIAHEIDHGLVRGLDYYTRTAFEVHDRSLGAQSALGGGGRYDGLIGDLGGPPTPGVGFSIGLDRVVLMLEQRGLGPAARPGGIYVAAMDATPAAAPALVRELRREFEVDFDLEARGFGAQMKSAGKSGARLLVLLGEEEWARGEVAIKDLTSGDQPAVKRGALAATLRERLG